MKPKAGVLCVQIEPKLNSLEENLKKFENLACDFISKNPDKPLDIIALPEFFLTGVSKVYANYFLPKNGGFALEFMQNFAKEHKVNLVSGSIIVQEDDEKLYNRAFVIDRNGIIKAKYDKIHLFKYFGGTEDKILTAGPFQPVVVDLDFGRLGLSICFDISHPRMYKDLAQMGAELVISPSAWGYLETLEGQKETNTGVFRALSIARAYENTFYFAGINQAGRAEGALSNTGHSIITSPLGEILAEADDKERVIYAEIDLEFVRRLKTTTPIAFDD